MSGWSPGSPNTLGQEEVRRRHLAPRTSHLAPHSHPSRANALRRLPRRPCTSSLRWLLWSSKSRVRRTSTARLDGKASPAKEKANKREALDLNNKHTKINVPDESGPTGSYNSPVFVWPKDKLVMAKNTCLRYLLHRQEQRSLPRCREVPSRRRRQPSHAQQVDEAKGVDK